MKLGYRQQQVMDAVSAAESSGLPYSNVDLAAAAEIEPWQFNKILADLRAAGHLPPRAGAVAREKFRAAIRPDQTQRKRRPCLRCRDVFTSEGPHNRLCPGCGHYAEHSFALDEPYRVITR